MAPLSGIEAKSPETVASREMELPSVESAPASGGAPGLLGLLSRPAFTFKLLLATLLAGAAAVLFAPAAFPPRTRRQPPPLPPRVLVRRPPRRPPAPLPQWMQAPPASAVPAFRRFGVPAGHPKSQQHAATALLPAPVKTRAHPSAVLTPERRNVEHPSARPLLPIRLHEPGGATVVVTRDGVVLDGERVPSEWAREARRLFAAAPPPEEVAPARPALRLLEPDPADASVLSPPLRLRWAPVLGSERYLLTLEVLTDPAQQVWYPVQDLFSVEVTGTEFAIPTDVHWVPGMLYRWRVETEDAKAFAVGRFRVLSEARRQRLLAAQDALGRSRMLRAAIYRAFGLYGEALTDLRALRAEQPQQPALRRAIANLEAEVHRHWTAGAG